MKIEIDQSGKIENTNIRTIVAFSNAKNRTVIVSSREKLKIQKYFRQIGKRKVFIYRTFATLIYFLTKNEKNIQQMIIDLEYPGQEHLIKNYLLKLFNRKNHRFDRNDITFDVVGKKSRAHQAAIVAYRKNRADVRVISSDIIKLI